MNIGCDGIELVWSQRYNEGIPPAGIPEEIRLRNRSTERRRTSELPVSLGA